MKKVSTAAVSGDRKGMVIATICFVHCVAGPLLLSFAGFTSLIGVSEKLEPVFVLSSLTLGAATLIPGYRRRHRRFSCLALFVAGLFCLLVVRHIQWLIVPEAVVVGVGALLIIGAHALNLRFSRMCQCCCGASAMQPERQRGIALRPR